MKINKKERIRRYKETLEVLDRTHPNWMQYYDYICSNLNISETGQGSWGKTSLIDTCHVIDDYPELKDIFPSDWKKNQYSTLISWSSDTEYREFNLFQSENEKNEQMHLRRIVLELAIVISEDYD
jgi:hypothetical protein